MASPEYPYEIQQQAQRGASSHEPLEPSPLPPELVEFLRDRPHACLLQPTDEGAVVLIVKLPRQDIESAVGTVPIELRHQLHDHPAAPVIRIVTTIYDQPDRPLALEAFINVGDPQQRSDYEALKSQDPFHMLFYDENLTYRLTKAVGGIDKDRIADILSRADRLFNAIPEDQFNFDIAKAAVMARTTL